MNLQRNNPPTRRDVLRRAALGFGGLAMSDLLTRQALYAASPNPLAARTTHFPATAKRAIYIFLDGGISQVDTWDYKPRLQADDGKELPPSIQKPKFTFARTGRLLRSPFRFKPWGRRGMWASDLFPHLHGRCIDDLTFIHSLHHRQEDHFTAKNFIFTGAGLEPRPTAGSWAAYGLGTVNDNLPGYIEILPGAPQASSPAFLPADFAPTAIGKPGPRDKARKWDNLDGAWEGQRQYLDLIQTLNHDRISDAGADAKLEAEVRNMELAFRMQTEAPDIMSLQGESEATRELYGIGQRDTDDFARALLMARRFAERGVRYVTVYHSTRTFGNLWDQHKFLEKGHRANARAVDQPIAGFLLDLKSRGLLDDTLVMCGSEFGRTPVFEYMNGGEGRLTNGRDHNPHGFTMWFAGGGFQPGASYGATDDYGYYATQDPVTVHDMHATVLHAMGMDHEKLTYRHGGRDYRLTDVYGSVVRGVLRA